MAIVAFPFPIKSAKMSALLNFHLCFLIFFLYFLFDK